MVSNLHFGLFLTIPLVEGRDGFFSEVPLVCPFVLCSFMMGCRQIELANVGLEMNNSKIDRLHRAKRTEERSLLGAWLDTREHVHFGTIASDSAGSYAGLCLFKPLLT
jgi:hypothetical protein